METTSSGGFRIESSQSRLEVTKDRKAFAPTKHARLKLIVRALILAAFGFVILMDLAESDTNRKLFFIAVVGAIFLLRYLFARRQAESKIVCTRNSLQVIHLSRGKVVETSTFPKDKVGPIKFAEFSASRSGANCGLLFVVEGRKVKVLSGLELVEADKILKELGRLGYQVVRDVGMPMAVEMALERRNAIFGGWL